VLKAWAVFSQSSSASYVLWAQFITYFDRSDYDARWNRQIGEEPSDITYNILQIRRPDDPDDPLYPVVLDQGSSVRLIATDGSNRKKFIAVHMSVWEVQDGNNVKIGDIEGKATIILTDVGLLAIDPNFKSADTSLAVFDMPNLYLVSAALGKLRTHNRAMVGHIPLRCIYRVSALGTGSKRHKNQIRVYMAEDTDGTERKLFLQLTLSIGTDPRPVAASIVRRIGRNWFQFVPRIDQLASGRPIVQTMQNLQQAPLLETNDASFQAYSQLSYVAFSATRLTRLGMAQVSR
jgi:hypothetical protein